ncbi:MULTISPECIES: hypothetical protein [unclassified Symbiopectobacterium]|uniref:hypothetical protein n=1 Tax=unclassified Symbiopectobacterium TaxID=2794573 RepID=UPI0022270426|nr:MULTISPECIES: hypothetical protein [unclassified Symbiopectobacterium]MCW2475794.1 hypothetical protein [Candidatus Symbiopectobacterium sp. NZEC151]MCW2486023.1 hypothetical protein [Candidatus Symbiopectobacterium sp. NZEC127]
MKKWINAHWRDARRHSVAGLCLLLLSTSAVLAADHPTVATPSTNAQAQVMRAVRQNGELLIELRFETTADTFGGETIYENMTPDIMNSSFYIEAQGQHFTLSDTGKAQLPTSLRLNFSYDRNKNPRVGAWRGRFVAPPTSITQVELHIPGLALISGISITDRGE